MKRITMFVLSICLLFGSVLNISATTISKYHYDSLASASYFNACIGKPGQMVYFEVPKLVSAVDTGKNLYSTYYKYSPTKYLQRGATYIVLSGYSKSTSFSVSVSLKTPSKLINSLISTKIGYTVSTVTINLTGTASPVGANNYWAPYYRSAWHVFNVTENMNKYYARCMIIPTGSIPNATVYISSRIVYGTANVPFRYASSDPKYMIWGKSNLNNLPSSALSTNPIFIY